MYPPVVERYFRLEDLWTEVNPRAPAELIHLYVWRCTGAELFVHDNPDLVDDTLSAQNEREVE